MHSSALSPAIVSRIAAIPARSPSARHQAEARQNQLTKPTGSLGRLETLTLDLASMTGDASLQLVHKQMILMAGDHGVTAEGISAYPAAVTPQMVHNFWQGGAAINALAQRANASVLVIDAGIATPVTLTDPSPVAVTFNDRHIGRGTANMAKGPAMSPADARAAIEMGMAVADEVIARGADLIGIGEMGIGNTTAASALTAALLGVAPDLVTGRGTGLDDAQLAHKVTVIQQALTVNHPDISDPLTVLAALGGYEIAGLVGVLIAAAARRVPVVLDGFITGAAALVAVRLAPAVRDYIIASHLSVEQGHRLILADLGLVPLFNLDLRLGEGSGAAIALLVIDAALATYHEMATFGDAGVDDRA